MSRLHKLIISNIQEIKDIAYEFDPKTNVLIVCGDNGAGKSTFLKAAEWLFCGDKPIPECPIRDGEKTASIEGTTDDGYVVTKKFKYDKNGNVVTTLTVRTDPSMPGIKSPQTYLWEQIKNQMIDPVRLVQKSPKDLRDIVAGLVNLDFDLEKHDKKWQEIFAKRTAAGYVVNQKKAFLVEIPLPIGWEKLPQEHVSAVNLNLEYQEVVNQNAENQRVRDSLEQAERDVVVCEAKMSRSAESIEEISTRIIGAGNALALAEAASTQIKDRVDALVPVDVSVIESQIKQLQRQLDEGRRQNLENSNVAESLIPAQEKVADCKHRKEELAGQKEQLERLEAQEKSAVTAAKDKVVDLEMEINNLQDVDTSTLNQKIEALQQTNEDISTVKSHFAAKKNWGNAVDIVTTYTGQLKSMDAEKDEAISMCKFPVPGLSVDVKGLIYNGRRLEQACTSEKHEILVSLQIALKPNAQWIIIHDVATWDKKTMVRMTQKANKAKFLFILERVDTDEVFAGTSKLVIHGGEAVAESQLKQVV